MVPATGSAVVMARLALPNAGLSPVGFLLGLCATCDGRSVDVTMTFVRLVAIGAAGVNGVANRGVKTSVDPGTEVVPTELSASSATTTVPR